MIRVMECHSVFHLVSEEECWVSVILVSEEEVGVKGKSDEGLFCVGLMSEPFRTY